MHRPRRVAFRNVERAEIVPVVFDLRPIGDGEAQIGEDFGEFVHHLAHRVNAAGGGQGDGQGHVLLLGRQLGVQRGFVKRRLLRRQRGGDGFAQTVEGRAVHGALVGAHTAQRLQQGGDAALLAHGGHPHGFQRLRRGGSFNGCEGFGVQLIDAHGQQRLSQPPVRRKTCAPHKEKRRALGAPGVSRLQKVQAETAVRRRRATAPVRPKPASSSAQLAGSGTAPAPMV